MISFMSVACVYLVKDQQRQQHLELSKLAAEQPKIGASGTVRQTGGMDRPSRTKSRSARSLSSKQPGEPPPPCFGPAL